MKSVNVLDTWLSTVGFSHSNSKSTDITYRINFQKFLDFIEKTPEQILTEYEKSTDRRFKRKYAQYAKALIGILQKQGYSPSTVNSVVAAVRSFFKYNDLPLGFVPSGSNLIEFHNRDISREEIQEILKIAGVRERTFFCMMAQSGLRPSTIVQLKMKDVEAILEEDTPIPCKITVSQKNTKGKFQGYFTFMGKESVTYLKDYLKTREKRVTPKDYLFVKFGHNDKPISAGVMTHLFRRVLLKLKDKGIVEFETGRKDMQIETRQHEPLRDSVTRSELRLYNLRKFFRKYAGQAGNDYVNFWMGHTSALGVDLHYFSQDIEYHRKQYEEKAMPHLRLETATPSETDKIIQSQAEEIKYLRTKIEELEEIRDIFKLFSKRLEELEKKTSELAQGN